MVKDTKSPAVSVGPQAAIFPKSVVRESPPRNGLTCPQAQGASEGDRRVKLGLQCGTGTPRSRAARRPAAPRPYAGRST